MSFKKVEVEIFSTKDEIEEISEYGLLEGRDKRKFTREIAKEYLDKASLSLEKRSMRVRAGGRIHLFIRGER